MQNFKVIRSYIFAVIVIVLAASLRLWPLQSLGLRTVWVTFYPAVMLVALYGGVFPGLLASVISVVIVLTGWRIFVPKPFINDFGDWLSLTIFMVTCIGISVISEVMRRSQDRLKLAKDQAERANKAKSVFLSNMSHELRTPFNAILGFSQIMVNDQEVTRDQKNYLGIIIRSSEHLLHLINNILDIAKIESGKIHLEEKEANLIQLIHEVQLLMGVKANEKGLKFSVLKSADLPVRVLIDEGKLRQVLINLIGNGIKFTKEGSITIRASVVGSESGGRNKLRFEIEDTGTGISEADQSRIFQPFVQLGNNQTTEAGTGLGLAICKQNIELMGGVIQVEGNSGHGSVFSFEIPVKILKEVFSSNVQQFHRLAKLESGQRQYSILIAEDQYENRLLLNKLLESAGFKVYEVVNGKMAVEFCQEYRPDLVFMDLRMPIMGGVEATKLIKSIRELSHIKIVAITAHALADERQEMFDAGCDEFIRKPYSVDQIFEVIEMLLGAKFVCEPVVSGKESDRVTKSKISLEALPPEIRSKLIDAAVLLDEARCIKIIDDFRPDHPQIAEFIQELVVNFEYQVLINQLEHLIKEEQS